MSEERIVLVTGATGGIGPAVVRGFAAQDAKIALVARNSEKLERTAANTGLPAERLHLHTADIRDPTEAGGAVDSTAEHFGRIDVVINLIGSWARGHVADTTDDLWHDMLATNLHSVFYVLRAAAPHLHEGAVVVNVGNHRPVEGRGGQVAYAVAKGGIHVLTRSFALELRDRGVRVNAILPTNVDTPGNRRLRPNTDPSSWPSPDEVAQAIVLLASPSASAVTGALVPVGGRDHTW